MRTLRLALAGTVMLALLGGLGGAVHGQTDSDAYTTGTIACALGYFTEQTDDSVVLLLGSERCEGEWSDPRVNGVMEVEVAEACFMEAGDNACIVWGASELTGPDGTWVGSWTSIFDAETDALPISTVATGTGAYEGWTYISIIPNAMAPEPTGYGIIYEGPPPPWGETLPLVPAE